MGIIIDLPAAIAASAQTAPIDNVPENHGRIAFPITPYRIQFIKETNAPLSKQPQKNMTASARYQSFSSDMIPWTFPTAKAPDTVVRL